MVTAVLEPELFDEGLEGRRIALAEGRTNQPQHGPWVVEAPVDRQHLDQVVRRLVRRDLADEEQVRTATGLVVAQAGEKGRVRWLAGGRHVDQQRHHVGVPVARSDSALTG